MEAKRPEVIIDLERYNELLEIEKRDRKDEGTKIVSIFEKTLSSFSMLRDFSFDTLIRGMQIEAEREGFYFAVVNNELSGRRGKQVLFKKKEEE